MANHVKIKLNQKIVGRGQEVVFLHGFLESESMWDYLDLGNDLSQIRFDLPGHGRSNYCSESLSSMDIMADLVQKSLDELNCSSYNIVGHSMGGYVALELMKRDDRCKKLVLLNSNFWSDDAKKKYDRERIAKIVQNNKLPFLYEAIPNLFMSPENHELEIKRMIEDAKFIPEEVISKATIAMSKRLDFTDFIKKRKSDILIIQGKYDSVVPLEAMNNEIGGSEVNLVVFDNCGHMAHIEQSKETTNAIKSFVK